jgi:Nucleotidyltransferase of unknown function (DUF6036)
MATQTLGLWRLVRRGSQVDPRDLADAVCRQAEAESPDYRTRLLIRDSVDALRAFWGEDRVTRWLDTAPSGETIRTICAQDYEEVGFPSIRRRLVDKTQPEHVRQFLEEAGRSLHNPVRIYVGGSVALIMPGYVDRQTDDIDVVGEVPKDLRDNHALMNALMDRYALHLGHVQPHYFARGWQDRAHSLDTFGRLQVYLLDVYDVFLSKLFSVRDKDRDDLRVLIPQLDKDVLVRKFKESAGDFLAAQHLKDIAIANWKILFGEDLPS